MAEALGVAASAISLLAVVEQIVHSINRLRDLHTFMKAAPDELQNFIEDIETVQEILLALKPEMFKFLNVSSAERRLLRFQKDLDMLILTVQKYKKSATKKLGALRLALEKHALDKKRQNLDNVRTTLLLVQQAYCSASLYEIHSRISSPIVVKEKRPMNTGTSMVRLSEKGYKQRLQYKSRDRREIRFRTPIWFVDKIWSIGVGRFYSGFTLNIQTQNVIPQGSPIFQYCADGEVDKIQELFASRLASPFDCDFEGITLLHVAASNRQLDVCRLLLHRGANPELKNNWGYSAMICPPTKENEWMDQPSIIPLLCDIYRLLIEYCGDELFDDDPATQASGFQAPPEVLTMMQGYVFEDYSKLPLEFRFKQTTSLLHTPFSHPSADIIRVAMGGGSIDPAAYFLENEGETLLNRIVRGLALVIIQKRTDYIAGWRHLLADAVAAGADLCYVSSRFGLTPLMLFLSYFTQPWCIPKRNHINAILEIWLSELLLAGVDLAVYGAREKALHASGAARTSLFVFNNGDELRFRLFLVTYGANQADWNILSTDPVDSLVGQFWEMVERAEERMPGAWVE